MFYLYKNTHLNPIECVWGTLGRTHCSVNNISVNCSKVCDNTFRKVEQNSLTVIDSLIAYRKKYMCFWVLNVQRDCTEKHTHTTIFFSVTNIETIWIGASLFILLSNFSQILSFQAFFPFISIFVRI